MKKKYIVIANDKKDDIRGVHYCNVNFKKYAIKLGVPVPLDEAVLAYLRTGELLHTPGVDLLDDATHIDIAKESFKTNVSPRFKVTEYEGKEPESHRKQEGEESKKADGSGKKKGFFGRSGQTAETTGSDEPEGAAE